MRLLGFDYKYSHSLFPFLIGIEVSTEKGAINIPVMMIWIIFIVAFFISAIVFSSPVVE